jgi:rRNA maturation protein Nop10
MEEERRYIDERLANAEANTRFFSNPSKFNPSKAYREYRERLTCAMFLRALGYLCIRSDH